MSVAPQKPPAVVRLHVNKSLYSLPALLATAQAYSDACLVTLNEGERYYEVSLAPKHEGLDPRRLEGEFLNYLLSLAKSQGG